MEEIWKSVKGYEGLYEVSNYGNVRSVDRIIKNRLFKGQLLKPRYKDNDKNSYLTVNLKKNSIGKTKFIHKLVADVFVPNPNNYPQVNHKDEVKTNNKSDNLEWCTCAYNCNYGKRNTKITERRIKNGYVNKDRVGLTINEYRKIYRKENKEHLNELARKNYVKKNHVTNSRKIKQFDLDGNLIKTYNSAKDAERDGFSSTSICKCCKGKRKISGGYKWEYFD